MIMLYIIHKNCLYLQDEKVIPEGINVIKF